MPTPQLRSFASIVCHECLYLEFPGCDVHGLLYTDPILINGEVHAKCPKCTAATHNQRPFREGCRRCKGKTSIHTWTCTSTEISQAFRYFPMRCEEIDHAVLKCEEKACSSVVFPSSREVLTTRTPLGSIVTSTQRVLKVSNFQLSMPHIAGCPRQGMPLQTIPVRLPKSELKFVLERIEQCPLPPPICVGPMYRKRQLVPPRDTNQLHHIYLRLFATIVKTFDYNSTKAIEPLKQIGLIFNKAEVMSMFNDWAPPSELLKAQVQPKRTSCTSQVDEHHSSTCVNEYGMSYWKGECTSTKPLELVLEFEPSITVYSIALRWNKSFACSNYTVHVSKDAGGNFETIGIMLKSSIDNQITLSTGIENVNQVKIVMGYPHVPMENKVYYGLECFQVFDTEQELLYTPPNQLLQDVIAWVAAATRSECTQVRVLALQLLEKLALTSGSLCALLHVVQSLLHTSETEIQVEDTIDFITQLAQTMKKVMLQSNSSAEHARLEKRIITQMSMSLQDEVTRRTIQILQNIPGLEVYSPAQNNEYNEPTASPVDGHSMEEGEVQVRQAEYPSSQSNLLQEEHSDDDNLTTQYPILVTLLYQPLFVKSIQSRTELAMVLLSLLGEISIWQMHRMQKPEVFVGRREEELGRLEDAFSIQVCPDLFLICHNLLQTLLSPWLSTNDTIYDQIMQASCHINQFTQAQFTPMTMGLAVLQIITANVRRLVLSQVNPGEIGLGMEECNTDQPLLPMIQSLEKLISLGTKQADPLFGLSLQAAAAVEVGMEAFYPSPQQRTMLLTNRMGNGATLEFQLRWPVQEGEQEDPRYERLILLLQLMCIKHGYGHALRGQWNVFLHLLIQVPENTGTGQVLNTQIAECIQQAGFSGWHVVAGAQEISITLQRHLHWNRIEKMSHDSGSAWIRVIMLGKLVLVAALSAAYVRPDVCLSVASLVSDQVESSSHNELLVRVVLTLISLTAAIIRTRTTYLPLLTMLVTLETICLQLHITEQTFELLPMTFPSQLVFFRLLAMSTFALMCLFGFFVPLKLTERQMYRKRLVEFYKKYNPDKLDQVDNILRRYRHHEEVLFTRLKQKYIMNDPIESEEESDDEHETSSEEGKPRIQKTNKKPTRILLENDEEDKPRIQQVKKKPAVIEVENDEEDELQPLGTPPSDSNLGRADTTPLVQATIQQVQAEQQVRIEQRIQRLKRLRP
ncbi:hypothetical protein THRCLA_11356 [Thraustotheca clavata]|uniref:F5/8 type C domain-containing protein n=1 Tax=Thraustotheca clavata TaxID=74557 RepID=A0A1V9Y7Y4_9STRA|nr:hypothetical protein THRCLA_11356 [Thraustotheca clavata]